MGTEKEVIVVTPPAMPTGWLLPTLTIAVVTSTTILALRLAWVTSQPVPIKRVTPAVTTVIASAVGELKAQSRLVVLRANVIADVKKISEKRRWLIDFGTTTIWMRAPGQVEYVIDLEGVTADAFRYEAELRKLFVRLPAPYLDRDMVCVESDPAKVETLKKIGWGRLDKYSGQFVETQARKELRAAMIAAGEQQWVHDRSLMAARQAVVRLISPIALKLDACATVEVAFVSR
jgi:uncharacterized protein YfiM (DUF2279 family)